MFSNKALLFALVAIPFVLGSKIDKLRIRDEGNNDGPDNSIFSCGCDYLKNAKISDCQDAINQINVTSNDATDPMKGLQVLHTGPLSSDTIMYKSGTCSLGAANLASLEGPKGVGGMTSGTAASGQAFHDIAQAILDHCQDTKKGTVNGCASVGGGNLDVGAH